MSCWYYSNDDIEYRTPSREDGVPLSVENRYRRDGARFIINASNTLGLRYETQATGVVFFHRFFMIQSFKQFNRWVVAAACLLLAGKVEETPKKCKDVLKVTQSILTDHQMANFGSNSKEELLTHEKILLQTIKFDLQVQHPYSFLLKYAKSLKGDKQKMEKLVQTAWTFVNDSLSTVLCLQWEPQAIAVAFLYLAGKLAKYDLQSITQSKSRSWWRQFVDTLDVHDLDTICHQVLDTYGDTSSNNSQDEDENDSHLLTLHQTPPSTASIPPSLSVPPSGGVGHTTSSHIPPPSLQPHHLNQSSNQLLPSPQLLPSTTQLILGGNLHQSNPFTTTLVGTPPIRAVTPPSRAATRGVALPARAVTPPIRAVTPPIGSVTLPSFQVVQRLSLPNQSNISIITPQSLNYSTLNVPVVDTTNLQQFSQPPSSVLPQQQQLQLQQFSQPPTPPRPVLPQQQQLQLQQFSQPPTPPRSVLPQQQQLQLQQFSQPPTPPRSVLPQQQQLQLQQFSQPPTPVLPQQQQLHVHRSLTSNIAATIRAGSAADLTPPPPKRHALEVSYRPGIPQAHMHQVTPGTGALLTLQTNFTQQQQQQQLSGAGILGAGPGGYTTDQRTGGGGVPGPSGGSGWQPK